LTKSLVVNGVDMTTQQEEVQIAESYLCGLFWNKPEYYDLYTEDKISNKTFLNPVWAFFFQLGRHMWNNEIRKFTDITAYESLKQLNPKMLKKYEYFGEFQTIEDIMEETKQDFDNLDGYYDKVIKYGMLRELVEMLGERVLRVDGKYDYRKLNATTLHSYWVDRLNKIGLGISNKVDEVYLLEDFEDEEAFIENMSSNPSIGLEFHGAPLLTEVANGWDFGNVYIHALHSGRGKTSITFALLIMSCLINKEKLLVIANEQSKTEFQRMLLITALGVLKLDFNRKRLKKGNFTEDEKAKLRQAIQYIKDITNGNKKLLAFVFMESYTMDNVKKHVVHYANRGYKRVLIDTGKPPDDLQGKARWEAFTDDFKNLYKLARADGGGLNLAIWVNVQLGDESIGMRFLTEKALGDSKKIKNEASFLLLGRRIFDDEYKGEKRAVTVYRIKEDPFNEDEGKQVMKEEFELERYDKKGKEIPYYFYFVAKNRDGESNDTGLDVLVLRPNFTNNTWQEIGWTTIRKDF